MLLLYMNNASWKVSSRSSTVRGRPYLSPQSVNTNSSPSQIRDAVEDALVPFMLLTYMFVSVNSPMRIFLVFVVSMTPRSVITFFSVSSMTSSDARLDIACWLIPVSREDVDRGEHRLRGAKEFSAKGKRGRRRGRTEQSERERVVSSPSGARLPRLRGKRFLLKTLRQQREAHVEEVVGGARGARRGWHRRSVTDPADPCDLQRAPAPPARPSAVAHGGARGSASLASRLEKVFGFVSLLHSGMCA